MLVAAAGCTAAEEDPADTTSGAPTAPTAENVNVAIVENAKETFLGAGVAHIETLASQLQRQANRYKKALLTRDPRLIEEIFSRALLVEARKMAGTADFDAFLVSSIEPQRKGLVFTLGGEEAAAATDFEVLNTSERAADWAIAAELGFKGAGMVKALHFVRDDDGVYRLTNLEPIPMLPDGMAPRYWWSNWRMDNNNAYTMHVSCGSNDTCGGSSSWQVTPYTNTTVGCDSYKCTWYGSTCAYFNGVQYCGYALPCYYQSVGNDVWVNPDGSRYCHQ